MGLLKMFHKTPSGSLVAARAGSRRFRRDHLPGGGEVLFAAMQGYFTLGGPWIPSDEGLAPVSTHQLNSYGVDQHFLIVSAIGAARRRFMNAMGLRALRQSEGDSARERDAGRAVMAYQALCKSICSY